VRPARRLALTLLLSACAPGPRLENPAAFTPYGQFSERILVLDRAPGVTVTLVAPARIDPRQRVDLILYALPNGNTTAETMGRRRTEGVGWRFDIQHIAAQTRALRTLGLPQAAVAYLEADTRSWPEWRRVQGYERANARIVALVDEVRAAIGNPPQLAVTLAGHSGGGSFMFGFIEGQQTLPPWLERVAFLDANYNFAPPHGDRLVEWLRRDRRHTMVVLAYDDREIMLEGKKVVSDSGGTWRASRRMLDYLQGPASLPFTTDTLGGFQRYRAPQIDILLHPNPDNRILHTEMIGEMNGYMHALLARRSDYERGPAMLTPSRAYGQWVDSVAPRSLDRVKRR
jgi:hypothetical protein